MLILSNTTTTTHNADQTLTVRPHHYGGSLLISISFQHDFLIVFSPVLVSIQHFSRGQRKIVANRYDSEEEQDAILTRAVSFNTGGGGSNSSISSSLSGSSEMQQPMSPSRRIRVSSHEHDDIIIADSPTAATNAIVVSNLNNNSDHSDKSVRSTTRSVTRTVRHHATTMTTTTTTTVVTETMLCLEPTSISSFSSNCLLSPSDVGAKRTATTTRGQQLVTRPGRFRETSIHPAHVNTRDDDDSEDEDNKEEKEYKTLPKRATSSSGRGRGTIAYRARDDNASHCSGNNSSVGSSNSKNRKKWTVVDVNKGKNNIHYTSTASMPTPRRLYVADMSSSRRRSDDKIVQQQYNTQATSAIKLLNEERLRAAELRTARMRAMMHDGMIRPDSFRGFSRRQLSAAAAAAKSTAAPVKPCRVKSSDAGKKPLCPVNTIDTTTNNKPCQVTSSSSKAGSSPRCVNRLPSSNNSMTRRRGGVDNTQEKEQSQRHHLHRNASARSEEASDIDSLVPEEEEHIQEYMTDEEEECVSEGEYTEEEVLTSDDEEEEVEQEVQVLQSQRVGRWGEQEQQAWKSRGSDPSMDVTEDTTEDTTQYDSEEEQTDVVKKQKYEPYFAQFDDLMRSRQRSRRAKDQIKLSPGAMSLKDRLAMFQGK